MCVTLAGNESHPAVADEDKGPTDSKGSLRPEMLESVQKSSKTFYFFPKVGDSDGSLGTHAASRERCAGVLQIIYKKLGNKAKGPASKTNSWVIWRQYSTSGDAPCGTVFEKWRLGLNKATEPHTTAAPWQHD